MGFQTILIVVSFCIYLTSLIIASSKIWGIIKKIPLWLFALNIFLLIYKIFFVIHDISGRGDYGIWLLGAARRFSLVECLRSLDAPFYFFYVKLFSFFFSGISYNYIVNFHTILNFFNIFSIFIIVYIFTKNRLLASSSSLFFAISPIIFVFTLTEDYTNSAIFFSIQSFLFLSLSYCSTKKYKDFYVVAGLASSVLTIYSRPEYFFFQFLALFFLYYVLKLKNKFFYIIFTLALLPRVYEMIQRFNSTLDEWVPWIHGFNNPPDSGSLLVKALSSHVDVFLNNFSKNLFTLFDLATIMGLLFLLFLIALIYLYKNKKYKNFYLYFTIYFLFIFFYYSFLHWEGLFSNYKYVSSLVLPLSILASFGLVSILKNKKLLYLFFTLVVFCSLFLTSSLNAKRHGQYHHFALAPTSMTVEYYKYIENKEVLDYNASFLSNGYWTFLFSALKIDDNNIFGINNPYDLLVALPKLSDKIYVSQGMYGGLLIDSPEYGMTSKDFEVMINKYFKLNKVIFYYHLDGRLAYLYEMSKK